MILDKSKSSSPKSVYMAGFKEILFLEDYKPFKTTDKLMCNKCKRKMPSAMKTTILSAPQVLVIQILRYSLLDPTLLNVNTMPNNTLQFGNFSYKLRSVICILASK